MFCSECGAPNSDDVSFCGKCGNPLKNPSSAMPSQQSQPAYASPPPVQQGNRKSPIVAAFLNLFIGLGYLYLGYRKVFGLPTILFVILVFLVDILLTRLTFGLVPLIIAILLAYDGYVKARGEKGYVNTEPALLYQ
ncbi:MAG: zinc-ribbon domain-containing protein [Nitrososphaerales archaeon]